MQLPSAEDISRILQSARSRAFYDIASTFRTQERENPGAGWGVLARIFQFHQRHGETPQPGEQRTKELLSDEEAGALEVCFRG